MRRFLLSTTTVLMLTVLLPSACDNDVTTPTLGLALSVVSGDGQSGIVGRALASPLVIRATDSKGHPQRNLPVSFGVTSGGGSVSPASIRTDQNGFAQTSWTLGTSVAQAQQLEARASQGNTLLGAFTATPLPGPPAELVLQAGDGQSAVHDAAVAIAPAVRVRDQYGNAVPGASVTFAVTAGAGTVNGSPATSNGDGIATVGSWTLGTAVGINTVQATLSGVGPLTFTATATPGPAAHMTIQAGNNQTAVVYTTLPIVPAVRVTDAAGNPVPGVMVTFVVMSGGSFIVPDTASTKANGVAAPVGWVLHWTAGTTTLRATAAGAADTVIFTATGVHGPISETHGGIDVSPIIIDVSTGSSSALLTAHVQDGFNNPIAGATVTFAVTGTGNAITQPTGVTNAQGLATGRLSSTGSGQKRVSATADGVTIPTAPITVNPGYPRSVAVFAGDSQTGLTGAQLPINPTFVVSDEFGNPVPGAFLSLDTYGGGTIGGGPRTADANGLVSTIWILGPNPGGQLISAGSTQVNPYAFIHATAVTPAASIEIVQGDAQTAAVGTSVPVAPRVRVRNAAGEPVASAFVGFSVTRGDGAFSLPYPHNSWDFQKTSADGLVSVASWTLGPYAGPNTLEASVVGTDIAVTFTATGTGSPWTRYADLPTRRFLLGAAELGGKLYAAGGEDYTDLATLEAYDPAADAWSARRPMPTARYGPSVAAIGGLLYVAGGIRGNDVLPTLEVYAPGTDSWTTRAPMPTPREGAAVAVVSGIMYVIGGGTCVGNPCSWQEVSTVEAYDPFTDTWTTRRPMPTARTSVGGAAVNGIIYAIGGQPGNGSTWLSTVEAYDPATDTWTSRAPMPTAREGSAVGIIDGIVHVIGGNGAGWNPLATHEAYDPVSDSWSVKEPMPTIRAWSGAAVFNSSLFVIGGNRVPGMEFVEAYTP